MGSGSTFEWGQLVVNRVLPVGDRNTPGLRLQESSTVHGDAAEILQQTLEESEPAHRSAA